MGDIGRRLRAWHERAALVRLHADDPDSLLGRRHDVQRQQPHRLCDQRQRQLQPGDGVRHRHAGAGPLHPSDEPHRRHRRRRRRRARRPRAHHRRHHLLLPRRRPRLLRGLLRARAQERRRPPDAGSGGAGGGPCRPASAPRACDCDDAVAARRPSHIPLTSVCPPFLTLSRCVCVGGSVSSCLSLCAFAPAYRLVSFPV